MSRDRTAMRRVFDADVEAFRDHFGWTEGSDAKFAEFVEDPDLDPALWLVAFDGDEVAGAVLNGIHVDADGAVSGWLDSIFTRRPWRRRGLARALIARSLVLLRDRGLDAASLGVDLTNPHQALALYESCGFRMISSAHRLPQAPAGPRVPPARGGPPMIDHDDPPARRPPEIPGLRFRMFDRDRDYDALAGLIAAANTADGVEYLPTVDSLRNEHEHGGEFDPRRDLIVAEVEGEMVAAALTEVRTRAGIGVHHVEGWVHPGVAAARSRPGPPPLDRAARRRGRPGRRTRAGAAYRIVARREPGRRDDPLRIRGLRDRPLRLPDGP